MPTGTIRPLPGLTGRLALDGETMLQPTIHLRSGDSARLRFAVRADDEITPIDLTEAIVTFAVSDGSGPEALIVKRSYDDEEVIVTSPEAGIGEVVLRPLDTEALAGHYVFDLQIDRATSEDAATVGTATFVDGSADVILTGAAFAKIHVGSILDVQGVVNGGRASITAVDVTASKVTTAGRIWGAEASVAVSVLDGDRKTPEGLTGHLFVQADVGP